MRIERWWWLLVFCFVSLCIHVAVAMKSRTFEHPVSLPRPTEIEVALEPLPEPKPEPKKEEKPKPEPKKPEPKPKPEKAKPEPKKVTEPKRAVPFAKAKPSAPAEKATPVQMAKAVPQPLPPKDPGGVDPTKEEKPLPLGLPSGRKDIAPRMNITPADRAPRNERADAPKIARADAVAPDAPPDRIADNLPILPRRAPGDERPSLSLDNPLAGIGKGGDEKPAGADRGSGAGAPRFTRTARAPSFSGGGSPSPGPVPGGKGGFKGPEAPPEDILYNGGGAGGQNLPKAPPRAGGGGGNPVLSVNNPLAKDAVPEDRPGLGPGSGGGQGTGSGGGVGFTRGQGIGTSPDGKYALSTLRSKPGQGIGAGQGNGIGTRPPGGGRGTGAELPGTGGNGFGYGRGNGTGYGNGSGPGIASGGGGRGLGRGPGGNAGGGGGGGTGIGRPGGRMALSRGIPFGDIAGLLTGGDPRGGGGRGGGPGGRGAGVGSGSKITVPDSNEPVHMVYVLDISGSMRQGDKIGKAKAALKKALLELKPGDSFNIVIFAQGAAAYMPLMIPVSRDNVQRGMQFVDEIQLQGGTNISAAMELAFAYEKITHVFLLSDGEPSRGIRDPGELRQFVKDLNRLRHAQLITLALGLGEDFPGISLLKGLAEDNDGKFSYIDLGNVNVADPGGN